MSDSKKRLPHPADGVPEKPTLPERPQKPGNSPQSADPEPDDPPGTKSDRDL